MSISFYVLPGLPRNKIPKSIRGIEPEDVIKTVCKHFGCAEKELIKRTHEKRIVYPRQMAMYLIRNLCKKSLTETCEYFKSAVTLHTSVMHSVRVIEDYLFFPDTNTAKRDIEKITKELKTSLPLP